MKRAALATIPALSMPMAAGVYPCDREGSLARLHRIEPELADVAFLQVEIVNGLESAAGEWRRFEKFAHGTLYQNSTWCRAWTDTIGQKISAAPVIVTGRTDGKLAFLMPLQIRRRQGVRVLEWLGTPHHNYGVPLMAPGFLPPAAKWFEGNWPQIVERIGGVDAVALTENPHELLGVRHPLASFFNVRGANLSFLATLKPAFEELYKERAGNERRRTARKSDAALTRCGKVEFGLPRPGADLHALLDVMFDHQQSRLAERGIHGVFGPTERAFIHRVADLQDEAHPILAPYHLKLDGKVLAVMFGGLHGNGYWALIASLAAGPYRKHSPGDQTLRRAIADCCERGYGFFDFASGDTAYKRQWADEIITLSTILAARNLKGLMWCLAMAGKLSVKRVIKSNPLLISAAHGIRKILFAKR